jgi:hypothetical protein
VQVTGRRWRSAALAAVAAMVLGGCGLHPGTAAVVESTTISHDRVDEVAEAVCSANLASARASNQPLPTLATRGAREVAVQILVETELSKQFGEAEGVEPNRRDVSQAVAQNETGIAMLPEQQQETFRTALREYAEAQLILIEVGRKSLGGQVPDDQAIAEGSRLRNEFVGTLDVEVDPRYGHFEEGAFRRGGTSLSVPASQQALQGSRPQPDEAYAAALPASQQCR